MTTLYIVEQTGSKRSKEKSVRCKTPADLAKHITSEAKIKQFKAGERVRVRKGKVMLHIYSADYKAKHAKAS